MADVILINKVNSAKAEDVAALERSVRELNPRAKVLKTNSAVTVDRPDLVRDKHVLVVEDGPTLTHGGMKFGAGTVGARNAGASEIVDPRPYVTGTIARIFDQYDVGPVLPAEGYSPGQLRELEQAISRTPCDSVVIGTPMDLRHVIDIDKPTVRVTYELEEIGTPTIREVLQPVIERVGLAVPS
jgi:predicted GTPase